MIFLKMRKNPRNVLFNINIEENCEILHSLTIKRENKKKNIKNQCRMVNKFNRTCLQQNILHNSINIMCDI